MTDPIKILDAKATAGVGNFIYVKDYKHIIITVASSGLDTGKEFYVQALGSIEETAPTFGSAKSVSNLYDTVQLIKLPDGTPVEGSVGDLFSGSDDVRMYQVNTDGLTWITLNISGLVGAGVTASAKLTGFGHNN